MKYTTILVLLSTFAASSPTPSSLLIRQGDLPPPGSDDPVGPQYSGTGCPQGTVTSALSSSLNALIFWFDSFTVANGPGVAIKDRVKNCQLRYKMKCVPDSQFSIDEVEYQGYASVNGGSSAVGQVSYYFANSANYTTIRSTFQGPLEGDFLQHDEAPAANVTWSPCGSCGSASDLTINFRLSFPTTSSITNNYLTGHSSNDKILQRYYLRWRKCEGSVVG